MFVERYQKVPTRLSQFLHSGNILGGFYKTKIDSLVGLKGLCVIIMYFTTNNHILKYNCQEDKQSSG